MSSEADLARRAREIDRYYKEHVLVDEPLGPDIFFPVTDADPAIDDEGPAIEGGLEDPTPEEERLFDEAMARLRIKLGRPLLVAKGS